MVPLVTFDLMQSLSFWNEFVSTISRKTEDIVENVRRLLQERRFIEKGFSAFDVNISD